MRQLTADSPFVQFTPFGEPPERYIVTLTCKGVGKAPGAPRPHLTTQHQFEIYLHAQYPRIQPRLTWQSNIFHPNIMPPEKNGGVCIGGWTPAETLAQLCLRLGEMVQYKSYNTRDPLDVEAARWAAQFEHLFPIDTRPLLRASSNALHSAQ